jgi:K+-transporting ATPase ATPase A chain
MWLLPLLIFGIAVALAVPVGRYQARVFDGPYRFPALERRLDTGPQNWKQYAVALLTFNTVMFAFGFVVLALQPVLPLNPDGKGMLAPTTIFHITVSFFANNSLQHYAGEQHLSYMSQRAGIVWNMFVGGGTGLAVLTAVIRGLRGDPHLGNFYLDLWRAVAHVLLPACVVVGVLLVAAGVPMTFAGNADANGSPIARGPVAALVPVKNLASVGGGFFGANSAHPFENPNAWTNVVQCVCILLFPLSAFVYFGRMLGRMRHAAVMLAAMTLLFAGMVVWAVETDTRRPNPAFTDRPAATVTAQPLNGPRVEKHVPALAGLPVTQETGNLEGKELRFGPSAGATYAAATTAVSCGSVNCTHDSLNPLTGLTPFAGMWLNCVFGGKGVGLLNLLVFVVVAVFLTGLMVGRTPEYLNKKVEGREMKLAMLALLCHPVVILLPTGLFAASAWGNASISNPGPHGFSQIVYEFSSSASGNGSGFEGLSDTWGFNDPTANLNPPAPYSRPWDVATALVILIGRFVPIVAVLALAGGLSAKLPTPMTVGTLRTDTVTFAAVLLGVVLVLGVLLFLPVAALGPLAEHFGPIPFWR